MERSNNTKLSRRKILKAGFGGGAILLTKACALIPRHDDCDNSSTTKPFYIDVHNHVFNGQDINVSAFAYRQLVRLIPASNDLKPGELDFIRKSSEKLESIAYGLSKNIDQEIKTINKNKVKIRQQFKNLDKESTKTTLNELGDQNKELNQTINRAIAESEQSEKRSIQQKSLSNKAEKSALNTIISVRKNIQKIRQVFSLTGYRYKNALALLAKYPEVHLFTPALVDLYDPDSDNNKMSSLVDQIRVMSEICIMSNGRVLPFVSFDPKRDHIGGENFNLVKKAIMQQGFIGIKLYPPTGFRPARNAELNGEVKLNKKFFGWQDIDNSLHKLYWWCDQHGVPIMAHANNSMGFDKEYDYFGHPIFWEPVLEQYKNLRVNLGHFGGMEDLGSRTGADWPWFIGSMMSRHGNLYADLSNYNEMAGNEFLFGKKRRKRFKYFDNLQQMTQSVISANLGDTDPKKRLMYGTDWHMLDSEAGHERYFNNFRKHFGTAFCSNINDLMGYNAVNFLGLNTADSATNKSSHMHWLAKFFAENDIKPDWLTLLKRDSILRQ